MVIRDIYADLLQRRKFTKIYLESTFRQLLKWMAQREAFPTTGRKQSAEDSGGVVGPRARPSESSSPLCQPHVDLFIDLSLHFSHL